MTDEAQRRLERLTDEILPRFQEMSANLLSLAALQIKRPDDPAMQEQAAAVQKELQDMQPQLDELQRALDAAKRRG